MRRLPIPGIVIQVLIGIALGGFGLLHPTEELETLASIGLVLMLFSIGTEVDVHSLLRTGRPTAVVASLGVVLSMAAGIATALVLGWPLIAAIFTGGVLSATSIAISAKVLNDGGWLRRDEGRCVLGAAVLDDVIGLLVLGIVVSIAGSGGMEKVLLQVSGAVALTVIAVLCALLASRFVQRLFVRAAPTLILATGACLVGAVVAPQLGLEPFLGSFLAGAALPPSAEGHLTLLKRAGTYIAPLYFVLLGTHVPVAQLVQPGILIAAALVAGIGILSKLVSGAGALRAWDRVTVGLAMVPRGEVGMVFAAAGLAAGALTYEMYSTLVIAALVTSIVGPLLLHTRLRSAVHEQEGNRAAIS